MELAYLFGKYLAGMKGTWYWDLIMFNGKIRTIDLESGCERRLLKILLFAVVCVSFPRARTSMWESNAFVPWFPVLCPAVSWGWGCSECYLLPRAAGKLVFHSHSCENCFWYLCTSMRLRGSQECSLNSCAWNDVAILVGSPPLSRSTPCCSSLFPTHAQSTCFMFSLLHSCILPSVLNQFIKPISCWNDSVQRENFKCKYLMSFEQGI